MMKPWMLLATMILIGGAIFAVIVYKKHLSGGGDQEEGFKAEGKRRRRRGRERFETEASGDDAVEEDDAENDAIVDVAAAYRRIKGVSPSTSDVRRIMKTMSNTGDSASDVVKREMAQDKRVAQEEEMTAAARDDAFSDEEADEPSPVAKPAPKASQPITDAMDASMLRRVEDELESVVNRIDGLLEEIQAMKGRQVSGPLTDSVVESFVPYHPV